MSDPVSPDYTCYDPEEAAVASSTLLDVIEEPGILIATPGSLTVNPIVVVGHLGSTPEANVFYQGQGSIAPSAVVTTDGLPGRRFAPGTNQTSIAFSPFAFPLLRDLSKFPASIRRQHKMTWDTVLQRNTPLIAGVRQFIGMQDDAVEFGAGGAGMGVGLLSQSTLNGGAYTLQYKLLEGSALVTDVSTGIVPDGTPHHFRFEYYDIYPGPHLDISIDGTMYFSLTSSKLPVMQGQEPFQLTVASGGNVNTIGQQDHQFFSRFLVELL